MVIGVIAVLLLITGLVFYSWWSSGIRQPLGFSHAQHVRENLSCSSCHAGSGEPYPLTDRCAGCHKGMMIPVDVRWVRVYRTAPDIIYTHAKHTSVQCAVCHQAMSSAKRVVHETRFSMKSCMDCHRERNAANECRTCHKNR